MLCCHGSNLERQEQWYNRIVKQHALLEGRNVEDSQWFLSTALITARFGKTRKTTCVFLINFNQIESFTKTRTLD